MNDNGNNPREDASAPDDIELDDLSVNDDGSDSSSLDGSLREDEVVVDDSAFDDVDGGTVDPIGERAPMSGLAGAAVERDAGDVDNSEHDFAIGAAPTSVNDDLPTKKNAKKAKKAAVKGSKGESRIGGFSQSFKKLVNRGSQDDPVAKSGFAIGSDPSDDPQNPFSKSFEISDEDEKGVKILSTKERKKQNKKKSPIALGQKYGGQRKVFAFLAGMLIASLLLGVLNFFTGNSKIDREDARGIITEEIENTTAQSFPVGQASMWMESFVRIWGTWDYKTPAGRAANLSPYLAPGLDSQAGWNTQGTQSVIYSAVSSSPKVVDKNRAIFDAMYQIQDGTWRCVQVSVFAFKPQSKAEGPVDQWGFAVTSNPTPMPCALRVSVPNFAKNTFENTDNKAAQTLQTNFFPGFFAAWVTSDANALSQYMAPNVKTFGLGGAYEGNPEITSVILPIGANEESAAPQSIYSAYVTVVLTDSQGAKISVTYKVPVALTGGAQWQVAGEPEALVQGLQVGGAGTVEENEGVDPNSEDEQQEYSEPPAPNNQQPNNEQPTPPASSNGGG